MIKEISKKVERLLEKYPSLRDNDYYLVTAYWYRELDSLFTDDFTTNLSFTDFLDIYSKGKITPADSITRARRKLQELNPSLRGKAWNKRHKILEPKVVQEMREWNQYRKQLQG